MKKKEKGFLTIDFIFSLMAVYAISMLFAITALVLMVSDVAQYVSFSTQRAHIAGHISKQDQIDQGEKQFEEIASAFKPMISTKKGEWFEFTEIKTAEFNEYKFDNGRDIAYGAGVKMTAHLLRDIEFPLLGSPSTGAEDGFGVATLLSFMYREPTEQECLNFNKTRWEVILEKFPNLQQLTTGGDYGAQADNGC